MEQDKIKRLYRSKTNRIIFGVCGGLGDYFNTDPIIFRLIFVALTFGGGAGILLYIIMAFLVPNEPMGRQSGEAGAGAPDFKQQAQDLVSELKEKNDWRRPKMWLGIIIIILGLLLLFNQLLPRHFFNWGFFWAALIIVLGIVILKGKKRISDGNNPPAGANPEPAPKSRRKVRYGFGVWRLFWGVLLLVLGIAFLIKSLGLVSGFSINFGYLLKFWPVLIIFWGLSILSRGSWVGAALAVIFVLIVVGLVAASIFGPARTVEIKNYNFDIAQDMSASRAEVSVKSGAATIKIEGSSPALASGSLESNMTQLVTDSETQNGTQKVSIKTESNNNTWAGNFKNNLQINLSENIPLSLAVDAGASSLDLDLSGLQLEDLNLKSGASNLNLIFGSRVAQATVDIDAGVSSINISLPEDLGAKIYAKTGLSSKNFSGFRQIAENDFESDNYASSTSKIDINLEVGVSSISVTWR